MVCLKMYILSNSLLIATCQKATQSPSSEASPPIPSKNEAPNPPFPCPLLSYSDPSLYGIDGLPTFRPLIIAHR